MNVLKLHVSRNDELLWLLFSLWFLVMLCAKAPMLTSADFTSCLCAWFPSSQGSCPQHRGGRKLPYNWASIEIQRGLGTLGYCLLWLNVKMILPKWDMFCIFLQGNWGDENTKMFQNIASTLDILNQCSCRQHRLISPSSSQQGKIHPLCKEAGRTFRSHSGN